ncbi:MAG: cohesin domain-containing protein, partial [Euryarchaeota archaeon]|nr:cohesin domain-containing protein [Euryarchaeota archaeon]
MNIYIRMLICLIAISVLAAPSCAAPTPFVIGGWIFYENGTACDDPEVNITNLDTGVQWHANTTAGSNYYQIACTNGTDLNETEQLQFSAKSPDGSQSSITEHTVTQGEVDAGGFEHNITLESPSPDTVVSIGSAEGSVGDSVNVSINITDAPSICAMDIRVAYNTSILAATNVMNGSMIESLPAPLVEYHIGYVDINISFVTYPEAINGDGELFIVTFDIIGGDAGDSSILAMEAEAYTNDTPPQPGDMVTKNGVVNVTGGAADTTPPTITDSSPTGTGVPVTTDVTVTFDEAMNQTSAEDAFSIEPDVTGVFIWSENTMSFNLGEDLADNTTYDVTISTDAKDLAGNALADPSTWNFTTATVVPSSTTVSIENVTVAPGENITVPIMVNYVTDLGACAINITYNASVVHVTGVAPGDMTGGMYDSFKFNFDNGSGWMRANAANASEFGSNGNVVFAYVNLTAVGGKGDTSLLDITVDQLIDITYNSITHTVIDGTFTIEADTEPPLVTDASASRDTILNDNGRAR